jgi:hypothetical protein
MVCVFRGILCLKRNTKTGGRYLNQHQEAGNHA